MNLLEKCGLLRGCWSDDLERFSAIAYAYRSWPATDPAGVVERFNELVAFVNELIEEAEYNEREAIYSHQRERE